MFYRVLKEPLVHFLLIGLGLFLADGFVNDDAGLDSSRRIVVDRADLLTFMQYRSKAFEPDRFNDILNNLSEQELKTLIDAYVREEALYREAKALSLDRNDYVARQRLIQQLEFVTAGFISAGVTLSDAELQTWFTHHKDRYYVPPKVTFTHVFFSNDKHGEEQAASLAQAKLQELNDTHAPFQAATAHGDRFLYHSNYVAKEADEISSHFNASLQEKIFSLEANDTKWRGPYRSPYGYHLVLLTKRTEAYTPRLAEIRQQVKQDATNARMEADRGKAMQSIVDDYAVEIADELKLLSVQG